MIRSCSENQSLRQRRDKKVARRETSGIEPINLRALKEREESARTFSAGINLRTVPDVARLATFLQPLRGKRISNQLFSKIFFQLFLLCLIVALFSLSAIAAEEKENPLAKFSKILPEKIESFRKSGADKLTQDFSKASGTDINLGPSFLRQYTSPILEKSSFLVVTIIETESEYDAYSLFSLDNVKASYQGASPNKCEFGAACFREGYLKFIKGNTVVEISFIEPGTTPKFVTKEQAEKDRTTVIKTVNSLAKSIADNLPQSEEDIPSIIKHLPDWENVQSRTSYTRTYKALRYVHNFSLLDSMPAEEFIEAVVVKYDNAKLVVIEHNTPQLAADADQRIQQKIAELKSQNQPVPTSFKRVGNYSVFVFDAPDEATANNLINQVTYEKTAQWLYGDPYEYERANRNYMLTTGGIIVTVLKTAGLALFACLVIGGGFGYIVFMRRRKQQAMTEAFSDAGGMLRLNLDEMTPQTDPARLLNKTND